MNIYCSGGILGFGASFGIGALHSGDSLSPFMGALHTCFQYLLHSFSRAYEEWETGRLDFSDFSTPLIKGLGSV